jgi:hypothetical protein
MTRLTPIVRNKALTEVRTCLSRYGNPALMADAEWQLSEGQGFSPAFTNGANSGFSR